uniref:Golgi apparatus membrane protein TVP38 n=1 Tax=Steinernema glaseri TaxID=37863 RepID=A0A1I7ZXM0_9BILA
MGKGKKKAATVETNGKLANGGAAHDKSVKFQPSTAGKSNGEGDYLKPSGRGMKSSPSLATLNRLDREKVVLWRRPFVTLWYFLMEILCLGYELLVSLANHKLLVSLASVLVGGLVVGYNLPGPHQQFVQQSEDLLLWYAYWIGLGVLSSVGFGSGLHTFVLYLAPFIAKVTMAAVDCDYKEEEITLWTIWAFVWKVTLMWGFGTAIGELPPYFMARTARLSGEEPDDEEYKEFLADLRGDHKNEEVTFFTKCKQMVERTVVKVGFFGIMLFASIPNPLFDLAGITCGHFLVPFHIFFGATFLGKAVFKAQLQAVGVILLFNGNHIETLVEKLGLIPTVGASLQRVIGGFIANQKARLHHGRVDESSNILGMVMSGVVSLMIIWFLLSIVNSLAQSYHKRMCDRRNAQIAKSK